MRGLLLLESNANKQECTIDQELTKADPYAPAEKCCHLVSETEGRGFSFTHQMAALCCAK